MKHLYVLACCLALQACGGGGGAGVPVTSPDPDPGTGQPEACSVADQRQALDAWMLDQYYWYPQMPAANAGAATLDAYFQSKLYRGPDRFSYTQTTESYQQVFQLGRRTGYGYTFAWDQADATQLRVRNVEPQGPAARAGLKRGDIVVAVDGLSPARIGAGELATVTTSGVTRVFRVRDAAGERTITVDSENFPLTPVAAFTTFDTTRNGEPVKVGYLAYHQFATYTAWELAIRMSQFASQGVGEMILDLRYNGGGAVNTARDLASMISGSRTDGQVFTALRFNDRQAAQNQDMPFMTAQTRYAPPLENLPRLIVLASAGTASASELLINGLKPFLPVVVIGETTYGKPYGFVPRSYCGTTFNAVQFESFNAKGAGGFTQGFAPDCAVRDDLDHDLGDAAERRTKAALDFISTGKCTGQSPMAATLGTKAPARAIGEAGVEGMFLE